MEKKQEISKEIFKLAMCVGIAFSLLKKDMGTAILLSVLLNTMFEFGIVERS